MATQSIESMLEEQQKKKRLLTILNKIANSAECGVYYQSQYTVRELKEKMKDIQALTAQALAE